MLDQRHRMILRFQRENLVETSTSSSDSDDHEFEPLQMMEHKSPLVRLITYGRLKKMMTQFQNQSKIQPVEAKLMRGMFKRH